MPVSTPASRRLCLFGGSFDPVHLAHVALAEAAWRQARLDHILFVPAWRSPHKLGQQMASAEDRLAMLRLAVAGLPWAGISTWELERAAPSYSWQTVEHFSELSGPETELFWLLGADQWEKLPAWARPEYLAARVTFLVFPRGDIAVLPRAGFRHQFIDVRHPASSTAVREAVRARQPLAGLVPDAVAAYITEKGLYRPGKG